VNTAAARRAGRAFCSPRPISFDGAATRTRWSHDARPSPKARPVHASTGWPNISTDRFGSIRGRGHLRFETENSSSQQAVSHRRSAGGQRDSASETARLPAHRSFHRRRGHHARRARWPSRGVAPVSAFLVGWYYVGPTTISLLCRPNGILSSSLIPKSPR
jgi:hypothetical protein